LPVDQLIYLFLFHSRTDVSSETPIISAVFFILLFILIICTLVIIQYHSKPGEFIEGGIRLKFCLLQTGDLHLVLVKEVLQLCVTVLYAVAIELQDPTPLKGRTCLIGLLRGVWGPSTVELEGMEFKLLAVVYQLEPIDARDERVASISEDSVGWELLAEKTGVEHVWQHHGEREYYSLIVSMLEHLRWHQGSQDEH